MYNSICMWSQNVLFIKAESKMEAARTNWKTESYYSTDKVVVMSGKLNFRNLLGMA